MTQEGMYMFLQSNTDKVRGFPRCTTLNDPEFKWTWQMVVWLLEGHVLTFSSAELSSVSAVRGAENSSSGWFVQIQQGGCWQTSSMLPLQFSPWIHHFWLLDPFFASTNDLSVQSTKIHPQVTVIRWIQISRKWTWKSPAGPNACFCWLIDTKVCWH